jgi:hypothetical protein
MRCSCTWRTPNSPLDYVTAISNWRLEPGVLGSLREKPASRWPTRERQARWPSLGPRPPS